MKILIVHNNYGKYSGEEAVVEKMALMFKENGHEVSLFRKTSEGYRESFSGKIKGFIYGIYSPQGVKGLREALIAERPDVVNIHNLFPFISPAALFECRKRKIPVLMTIHNFRLICPTGLFMRNEVPCEYCLNTGNEWSCIKYNCEHSWLKSIGYALRNIVARKTGAYKKCVSKFVCITDFQREKLVQAGFNPSAVTVIPNALDVQREYEMLIGEYVAFAGRLSREKGVDLIIEVARRHPEMPFKLAGEIRDKELVTDLPDNVQLMGYLQGKELEQFYTKARFFVMASKWYEGFPVSILEAAKFGKPTIGPHHGGFTEIIGHGNQAIGRLFKPEDVNELEQQVIDLWNSPETTECMGKRAYEKLKNKYSTKVVYEQWMELITNVLRTNERVDQDLNGQKIK